MNEANPNQDNQEPEAPAKSRPVSIYFVEPLLSQLVPEKLSPQVRALYEVISENSFGADEGRVAIDRATILKAWQEKISTSASEKVFSSYIYQYVSYGFLTKKPTAPKKPRSNLTPEQRRERLLKQISNLTPEEKAALLSEANE